MKDLKKWQQRMINRVLGGMHDRISELSALVIDFHAPTIWLDFLNADTQDSESMWPVYREFTRFIQTLKEQHECSMEITEMKLLSKDQFLERYPVELQGDAEKLHAGMKEIIDEDKAHLIGSMVRYIGEEPPRRTRKQKEERSRAEDILKRGADIPPVSFTMGLQPIDEYDEEYTYIANLHTPSAGHRNFWLSIIMDGMVTLSCNHERGEIMVRRCAAPDCRKYFVPTSRSHGQKYHSTTCRSRHNMQMRRS